MRIIAGSWRGRRLVAPPGSDTRPTADRSRQALFDMLSHARWGGPGRLREARVLDAFAGTGAFGLEALSRGAGFSTFIENAPAALAALRANIASCGGATRSHIIAADALAPPPGSPCGVIFLDPPYGQGLIARALAALTARDWLAPGALIVAESGREEALSWPASVVAERLVGAARFTVLIAEP